MFLILEVNFQKFQITNSNILVCGILFLKKKRSFLQKKKNPNINIPKRIITSNDKSHIKSVSMLSKQLKIQPQYDNNMNNITKIMQNNKSDDILFCGSSSEIVEIVHNLIYKLYYKTMNLKWNKKPEATYDSLNDFSTIWIIDPTDHTLKVYNYFDVFYNKYYDYCVLYHII